MEWFAAYAYQPSIVYLSVFLLMLLASFGLPLPEEVIIISSSLLAYMAMHPAHYPPPEPGAHGVNVYILACVCFFSVFVSDLVVFHIGKGLGYGVLKQNWFQSIVSPKMFRRARFWTGKYGAWMAGAFRFMPGIRFPGHMACGMLGIPRWKFALVDVSVVVITIPTQVFLISFYGEDIISFMKDFKFYIFAVLAVILAYVGFSVAKTIRNVTKARALRKLKMIKKRRAQRKKAKQQSHNSSHSKNIKSDSSSNFKNE